MPFVSKEYAGKECVLTRGPCEFGILMNDVKRVIQILNENGYNYVISEFVNKTHIAIDYASLMNNPQPLSILVDALGGAKVQWISLVLTGMRWPLKSRENLNNGDHFFEWIKSV